MTTKTALLLLLVITLTGNNTYLLKHVCFPSCVCCLSFVLRMQKNAISQLPIKILTLQLDSGTPIDSLYVKDILAIGGH